MADKETTAAEMVAPQASETPAGADDINNLRAELDETRRALKAANNESAKRRKRLEELEAAQAAQAEAELSEMERLQKQLADAKKEADALRHEQLRAKVAAAAGLPAELAARLRGETEDELQADAEALKALLPKPQPRVSPANPGENAGEPNETYDQARARIYNRGQPRSVFEITPQTMERGGGAFVNSGKG